MQKELVRKFYEVLWEDHDKTAIPSLLHADFNFRGSLGQQKIGHQGFADYLDEVHQALGDYRCRIEALVEEDDQVFAKMNFSGIHVGDLLGYPPSGLRVDWDGCALFTFEAERIKALWVLGDLKRLESELADNARLPGVAGIKDRLLQGD